MNTIQESAYEFAFVIIPLNDCQDLFAQIVPINSEHNASWKTFIRFKLEIPGSISQLFL